VSLLVLGRDYGVARVNETLTAASLRELERDSIRTFLNAHSHLLTGRTLDYGCGRQQYESIVRRAGGVYIPHDRTEYPANVSGEDVGPEETEWGDLDAILCVQVIQYVPDVEGLLGGFCDLLRGGEPGALLLVGGVNWPEVEPEERQRFTQSGIESLLFEVGFRDVEVEGRAGIGFQDFTLSLGWGAVGIA
jgi:SAM-dependent methyltransferase